MTDDIFFISMEGKKGFKINNFEVREDVALPLLVADKEHFSATDITAENVISGMIKVLINEMDNEHIDYYRQFIFSVKPDIEVNLTAIAYEAERNFNFKDALDVYKVLYALKPESIEHNLNIAVCYDEYSQYLYKHGRDKEAEDFEDQAYQFYKVLEEVENKDDRIYYYLGRFYLLRENYEKSIENFKNFIKLTGEEERKKEVVEIVKHISDRGLVDEDYHSAMALVQADRESEAIDFIDKYLGKFPKSWNGYFLKGTALRKMNKPAEALAEQEKALKFNPGSGDILNEIGLCYLNLNDFKKSEKYLADALKINPDDTAVIYNLALCSLKKGDKDEALRYCNVIEEFYPDDIHIKNLKKIIDETSI